MSREIEDLCEKNSRVFLDALEEVLRVRQGARKLKEEVLALQSDVSAAGQSLKDAVMELNAVRRARANVEVARATLLTCCDVLATCKRIQEYLTNGKYAASLRLMDDLETSGHLASVQQFELGQYVTRRLPQLKERIRREVAAQLSGWLQNAREAAGRVGRAALASSLGEEEAASDGESVWAEALRGLWAGLDGWTAPRNAASFHELVEGAGGLALAPPHRSLYIYSRLGAEQDFRELYLEARRATVRAFARGLESPLESLCRAVGFFVIEDAVGLRLLDESALHALWDASMGQVAEALGRASDGPLLAPLAMQTLLSERVAGALYLPLDRLQAAARHLARRHVCWGAEVAGRQGLEALLSARYSAPLAEKEFERLAGKHPGLALSSGSGTFTSGAVEALDILQQWKSKAAEWLEVGFGSDQESVQEGTTQWAAALGKGLAEHVEPNVGALVQLLVDAQVVAEISQGSSAALAEELATVWQPQLCTALLSKLRGLVGGAQQASLLDDVWPYLDAVLPRHLPAKLLAPLRVAAVSAAALLVRETLLAEANILPATVALMQRDAGALRAWSPTAEPDELLVLLQLASLLQAGPAMSSFLDAPTRANRWPLLWSKLPREELVAWLSKLREGGSSFFGGAKNDKNAEALAKKIVTSMKK